MHKIEFHEIFSFSTRALRAAKQVLSRLARGVRYEIFHISKIFLLFFCFHLLYFFSGHSHEYETQNRPKKGSDKFLSSRTAPGDGVSVTHTLSDFFSAMNSEPSSRKLSRKNCSVLKSSNFRLWIKNAKTRYVIVIVKTFHQNIQFFTYKYKNAVHNKV